MRHDSRPEAGRHDRHQPHSLRCVRQAQEGSLVAPQRTNRGLRAPSSPGYADRGLVAMAFVRPDRHPRGRKHACLSRLAPQ